MKQGQRKERTIGLAGRVEKVMGDILKILTECSFDNLFVLTGLAFTGIAIVGNVWGEARFGNIGSDVDLRGPLDTHASALRPV